MEIAEKLSPEQRKSARRVSIIAACLGSLAPAMIQDSAVIILFATILGAGDMLSMVTTSAQSLGNFLLLIPVACASGRIGLRRTIVAASVAAGLMIGLLAAAPLFGTWSRAVLLFSVAVFSLCIAAHVAAWFPLTDGFLLKRERGRYFGMMRFSWQSFTAVFFFVCGLLMGKNPATWTLQAVIVIAALGLLGRACCDSRLPDKHIERERMNFSDGLGEAVANKPLSGFSVYICFLYLAANSTAPLAFLYLKKSLMAGDNVIVIISSLSFCGMIAGFLSAGKIIDLVGIKRLLLFVHFAFAAINLCLALLAGGPDFVIAAVSVLLALFGFCYACSSIAISTEMLALASPGNKVVSMAYCGTFLGAGMGGSRMLTSLVLGSGMLAPSWMLGGLKITHYQTLFLLYGAFVMFVCLLLVLVPAIFPKSSDKDLAI